MLLANAISLVKKSLVVDTRPDVPNPNAG